ncbi:hypothetical protein AMJ48_02445 [Parcubacteria bacterium DG_74_1]|nr:MAG: hypothetical protein AMJ48_02445 [Parcubacteria bacterium DG_74_1]
MNVPQNEFSPFLEKFIKRRKLRFLRQGVVVIEDRLENLLLLIEALEERGIPLRDSLNSYYLKRGSILSKTVKLYISEKTAWISPGES